MTTGRKTNFAWTNGFKYNEKKGTTEKKNGSTSFLKMSFCQKRAGGMPRKKKAGGKKHKKSRRKLKNSTRTEGGKQKNDRAA